MAGQTDQLRPAAKGEIQKVARRPAGAGVGPGGLLKGLGPQGRLVGWGAAINDAAPDAPRSDSRSKNQFLCFLLLYHLSRAVSFLEQQKTS